MGGEGRESRVLRVERMRMRAKSKWCQVVGVF